MIATVEALDAADDAAFQGAVAPLFEGAPTFLSRLAAARPFGTWDRLFETARRIAHAMPEAAQVELVDAHPRLGAAPQSVSALSFREQGYDRPPRPDEATPARALSALNEAYEARFGFRYCVFVAGRSLESLIPELEAALDRDRAAELARALDAVVDIARARQEASR